MQPKWISRDVYGVLGMLWQLASWFIRLDTWTARCPDVVYVCVFISIRLHQEALRFLHLDWSLHTTCSGDNHCPLPLQPFTQVQS